MRTPLGHSANETWYFRLMAEHRRGLVYRWPLVLVALGVAIIIGVLSPDRSRPHAPHPSARSASVKQASP